MQFLVWIPSYFNNLKFAVVIPCCKQQYLPQVIPGRDRLPWHGCASFLMRLLLFVPRYNCFSLSLLLGALISSLAASIITSAHPREIEHITFLICELHNVWSRTMQRASTWDPNCPHSIAPEDKYSMYVTITIEFYLSPGELGDWANNDWEFAKHTRAAHLLTSIILQIYPVFLMFNGAETLVSVANNGIKRPPKNLSSSIERSLISIIYTVARVRVSCFENAK